MSIFPKELTIEILVRLPVKSLVRFQSVSKSWCALNNDPDFIKIHLQRSIQSPSEFTPLQISISKGLRLVKLTKEGQLEESSMRVFPLSCWSKYYGGISDPCNGLFYINDEGKRFIWNPSIRKQKMIPPVYLSFRPLGKLAGEVGIGYDPVNNDHKVVKIVQFSKWEESTVAHVLVYSLKKDSWRRVECEWPVKDFLISSFWIYSVTYLNGSLHWLLQTKTDDESINVVLLTFNLTDEKFQVHPLPMQPSSRLWLRDLGGNLCVYTTLSGWMLKEYGLASSWSALYSLPDKSISYKPKVISEDGQEILMVVGLGEGSWYNIKKKTWSPVEILESPFALYVVPSRGSLVLIDGDNDEQNLACQVSSLKF